MASVVAVEDLLISFLPVEEKKLITLHRSVFMASIVFISGATAQRRDTPLNGIANAE
jgi:hypothetical protein